MRAGLRSAGWILALGLLLTVAALWPASRLRIDADPAALMPRGSAAAADYRVYLERFGGLEQVFVLILAGPEVGEADLVAASDRLAGLLGESPEVARARSGLEEEDLEFLRRYVAPRAPLLLGDDWRRVVEERIEPEAIRRRVARIRSDAFGLPGSPRSLLLASDPFGFTEALAALQARSDGLPVDAFTGAFLSPDGDAALIVVTPTRTEIDPEGGRALAAALRAASDTVSESQPGLEFLAAGGPLYAAEDEQLIKRDVRISLIGSAVACVALLVLAFGGVRLPLAVLAGVAFGLIWTAAALRLSIGAVTAAGLGFSAVLIGLGIDYGIHGATRFRQHLLDGGSPGDALGSALRSSGVGVLTSALTTAGAFAVLAAAHFRPLRELGIMVAVGIVCILLTSTMIGAPMALLSSGRESGAPGRAWLWLGRAVELVTGFASRRAVVCLAALGLLSAFALWGLTRLSIDPDLRTFRSVEHSAFEAESHLAGRFGVGLDTATIVVSGAELETVMEKAERARDLVLAAAGEDVTISSAADWLSGPSPASVRLQALRELPLSEAATRFESELTGAGLAPSYFRPGLDALRELAAGRDPGPAPVEVWPDWLRELVRPADGSVFAALKLRLPEGRWPEGPPADLVRELREVAGGHVASATLVGAELRQLAAADLRALSGLALAAVALVVLISFRGHAGHSLLALTPVLLGALWSLGLWGALGRPLDLASLAVLPIVLGIGLDDGLHALHALRRAPGSGFVVAVREVGRAMLLTTATTCIAFGSLAATSVPGLRNAGLLVSLGVLGCLVATLVVLPALEVLGRNEKGARADAPGSHE